MRQVDVKLPAICRRVAHTIIQAAEQALPTSRARAGGRVRPGRRRQTDRPRAGGFVVAEPMASAHLLSVPVRCTSHQRLPSWSLEAGAPSL